jgi:predicted HicB family RNase H-like nuclease
VKTDRPERFEFRLSTSELRTIEREAKASGISLAEWLRRTALEHANGRCPLCGVQRKA